MSANTTEARRLEAVTPDHWPVCPRCGDVHTDPRRNYCGCGTRLYPRNHNAPARKPLARTANRGEGGTNLA